jgi:hypothetical protein
LKVTAREAEFPANGSSISPAVRKKKCAPRRKGAKDAKLAEKETVGSPIYGLKTAFLNSLANFAPWRLGAQKLLAINDGAASKLAR